MDYYSIAHTISESIACQADMLVGGKLKEYQVKGTVTQNQYFLSEIQLFQSAYFKTLFSIFGNLD